VVAIESARALYRFRVNETPSDLRRRAHRLTFFSTMTTLYEQLGGEAAIEAAVVRFYEKVMGDPSLAPFFADLDMGAQIKKQIAFMTLAFGGPNSYSGRDLRTAHKRLVARGLNGAHFDAVANHLQSTLEELGVARGAIDEVLAIVSKTRGDVLDE